MCFVPINWKLVLHDYSVMFIYIVLLATSRSSTAREERFILPALFSDNLILEDITSPRICTHLHCVEEPLGNSKLCFFHDRLARFGQCRHPSGCNFPASEIGGLFCLLHGGRKIENIQRPGSSARFSKNSWIAESEITKRKVLHVRLPPLPKHSGD